LEEGASPTDWVLPSVLGMPNLGDLERQSSISETSFQTPDGGQLVTRCMSLGTGSPTLPPDLLPLNASLKYPFPGTCPFLLLENLHQRPAEQTPFSAESCLSQFSALRHHNAKVFQATVTPKALEIWK
ncbi:MAG: TIGR04255 family protein, partial [bacterium]